MPKTSIFKRTHLLHRTQPKQNSCFPRSHSRVAPTPGDYAGYAILEIRPGRVIRIQHVNPTDPDLHTNYQQQNDHQSRMIMKYQKRQIVRQLQTSPAANSAATHLFKLPTKINSVSDSNALGRIATASSVAVNISPTEEVKPSPRSVIKQEILKLEGFENDPMVDNEAVLFFIHGVGGSSEVWRAQIDFFNRDGYEMIVPDLLGHGMSASPQNVKAYTFDEYAADFIALFDKFCKKRNVVIGHSYGFAAVIARNRPSRVSKLVFVSGGSPTPLAPQPGLFQAPMCCLNCCWPVIHRKFFRSAFHHSKTATPKDGAFDVPTYVLKAVMNGQVWDEGDAEYHEWINAPTLLIHGREDGLVSIEEEEEMVKAIFDCRLEVLDNASHMVMMEKPSEVNNLIKDFLLSNLRLVGASAKPAANKETSIYSVDTLKSSSSLNDSIEKENPAEKS